MVRDLEAQLLRVLDDSTKEFLAEAVRCYHSGAYRAAVVQAVAAGVHDLKRKLDGLVASGGAPPALITSVGAIAAKFAAQQPIERDVILAAERDAGLLSPSDAKALGILVDTRNLCAHPSGHQSSPEEARHIITSVIDLAVARPGLLGMVGVEQILKNIGSATFFPKPDVECNRLTAETELAKIHPSLYRALTPRLVEVIEQEKAASPTGPVSTRGVNATRLIYGMVMLGGDSRAAVWSSKRFGALVCNPATTDEVLIVLNADVAAITGVDALTRARLTELVRRNLTIRVARVAARRLLEAGVLTRDEQEDLFNSCEAAFLRGWSGETPNRVAELSWPRLESAFLDALVDRCGSSTWDTANAAISLVQGFSTERTAAMSDEHLARYILQVASVSRGYHASRRAESLRQNGLDTMAGAVDAIVRVAGSRPEILLAQSTDWIGVAEILKASGRIDAIPSVLSVFAGKGQDIPGDEMTELSRWEEPEVAEVAKSLAEEYKATK